jgi:transposase
VLTKTHETEEIIERIAALDTAKAELTCCMRIPHQGKPCRRLQEVATHPTMTRSLLGLADHLRALQVTRVVMQGHLRLLEAGLLRAGGSRIRNMASQCS